MNKFTEIMATIGVIATILVLLIMAPILSFLGLLVIVIGFFCLVDIITNKNDPK